MTDRIKMGMTRRRFVQTGLTAAGVAAFSPFVVFRAHAAPAPGELVLIPATANPAGTIERLFLLKGDPLAGPIKRIVTEAGNPVPAPGLVAGERRILRLLHFNDLHNHITDAHGKKGDTHRFSQIVKRVKETRAAAAADEAVLFISGGDDHTGSVFDELMGWTPGDFVADAGYRVYSAAGVDIAVLGNHEFDRGAELLKTGIETDARFPLLSANVHGSKYLSANADYVPAAVAEIKGLRIGLIGLTTNIDTRTGQAADPALAVASPLQAVENILPAVAEISDVVVILSHCGYGAGMHKSGKAGSARMIGEGDLTIAEAAGPLTDKPVVLIGGHSHTALNTGGIDPDNIVKGVLITQAGANGGYLGETVMSIAAENGRKAWFTSVGLHPVKTRDDRVKDGEDKYAGLEHDGDYDRDFEEAHVKPLRDALEVKLAEIIGTVAADAEISRETTVAQRYVGEAAIANFMNDALVERSSTFPGGKVDLAAFNATGLAAGVEPGKLSFRAWYDVMPYADTVHVATMTGAQIRDMLISNAKRIVRPEELKAGKVDLNGFVSRGFLHFSSGLRYAVKLGGSVAEATAENITIHGQPIGQVLDRTFTVAFGTYMALGGFGEAWNGKPIGGGVPGGIKSFSLKALPYDHTGLVYRNEVIAQIRAIEQISPATGAKLDGRLTVL